MQPYQQRVIVEKRDLDEKGERLNGFLKTDAFKAMDISDAWLLRKQYASMAEYSAILAMRIARFDK